MSTRYLCNVGRNLSINHYRSNLSMYKQKVRALYFIVRNCKSSLTRESCYSNTKAFSIEEYTYINHQLFHLTYPVPYKFIYNPTIKCINLARKAE